MGYYSDPTASQALGNINREFSKLEKRAKKLSKLLKEGKIKPEELEKVLMQSKGIYKHMLISTLTQEAEQ